MDARDFFRIADSMRTSAVEAERRTSIGRAYYGLYHVVLSALSDRGVIFRETPEDHHMLISYLQKGGNRTAVQVGNILKDIRQQRNDADYRLRMECNTKTAQFVYMKAEQALNQFDALSHDELSALVENIQRLP